MTQQRILVGAHYGWRDWLVQRITAVVMTVYTVYVLALLLWHGGLDATAWQSTFSGGFFRLATFLFMVSLLWHAWVGVRNILMDYVKPTAFRLTLEVAVIAVLVAYAGWTIHVLWGAA